LHRLICILTLTFALCSTASAQKGFKNELRLNTEEPSHAFHIEEYEGQYYMSGQYGDASIPAWNGFIAIYDEDGEYVKHHLISNDTLAILNVSHHVHLHEETYNVLSVFGGFARIVTYDFELDSFYTTRKFSLSDLGVVPFSFHPEFDDETFFFAGTTGDSLRVVKVTPTDTVRYTDGEFSRDKVALNMEVNSKDELIIVAEDRRDVMRSDKDSTHIVILDKSLNLLIDNKDNDDNPEMKVNRSKGMVIESDDNIVITGNQKEIIDTPSSFTHYHNTPSVAKFDSEGNHLWTSTIGNTIYNVYALGVWKSVIESAEKDGYVVVGGESFQPGYLSDTLIVTAAIAKLSPEGDSLWMRRYSWRTGDEVRDKFTDVVATSDGGYVAVGESAYIDPETEEDMPWIKAIIIKLDKDGLLDTSSVSTIQLDEVSQTRIFPNPATDYLYLVNESKSSLQVSILSMDGRVMDAFSSPDHTHTQVIDLARYAAGSYVIQVVDVAGRRKTHKFVVE